MHLLRITPEHRREALYESSINHHCPYCAGHAAVMGDLFRGPVVQQCIRRGDMSVSKFSQDETFKQLIHEVCSFPGRLTPDTRANFVKVYGEDGFKQLSAVLSFMGFLNFIMSATGMQLESRLLPFVEISLQQEDIKQTLRENVYGDGETYLGEEDVRQLTAPTGLVGWIFAQMRNINECFKVLIAAVRATMMEMSLFGGIPESLTAVDAWCLDRFGVLSGVLKNVDYIILKRAIALSMKLLFLGDSVWTLREKYLFLYVFAVGVGNEVLKDDAVALYKKSIADDGEAGQDATMLDLDDALAIAKGSEEPTDRISMALRYIHVCAGPGDRITEDIVDGLLRFVGEHGDIIDLSGMVGHFGFLNRASVLYPARE